jgi:hypothetical protein
MFVPSEQVIIAMEDMPENVDVFKEFEKTDPDDVVEQSTLSFGKRNLQVIHSQNLYNYFFEFISSKYKGFELNNLKHVIDEGKIKLYYITPKELMNLVPSSNFPTTQLNSEQCISFLSSTNDVVILLQGVKPLMGVDEDLFNIILKEVAKRSIEYVFSCKEALIKHIKFKSIFAKYYKITNDWYYNLIENIINCYNLYETKNIEELENKNFVTEKLRKRLSCIIRSQTYSKKILKEELLDFFKYDILKECNLVKINNKKDYSKDLIRTQVIGKDESIETKKKYLKEYFIPLKLIFKENIFQPNALLANNEFGHIMSSIKSSYEKLFENKIDVTHLIKNTIFQEFYNLHSVSIKYCEHKNEYKDILELLLKGEIFI